NYHGHLLVRVKSYAQDECKNAILDCRKLLELKLSVLSIIIKEPTGSTLWSEDKYVKCYLNQATTAVTFESTAHTKKHQAKMKYRGVEISRQNNKLLLFQTAAKLSLKYRGQSYSK
ncbi:MAG: hypothetical protein AB4038_01725, partial [Prochloraceae cyanobacterium]